MLLMVFAGCTGRDIIGDAEGWSPVAVDNGIVYVATRSGEVIAFDSDALERDERAGYLWKYEPLKENGLGSVFGPPAVGTDYIFVASSTNDDDRGKLIGLRKNRNSSHRMENDEWQEVIRGGIVGSPVLSDGKIIVGAEDGRLYAFKAHNGERLWTFESEGLKRGKGKEKTIWSTPLIHEGTVYFGSMDDYLYAISLESGAEYWKFKTGGTIITSPVIVDNKIIFGSFDRNLYALDISNHGRLLWTFTVDNWLWASPKSDGTHVYIADMDGKIYALSVDRIDGDPPKWVQDIGDAISSTPALSGNQIVVASQNGTVSLLDTVTGMVEEIPMKLGSQVRVPLAVEEKDGSARVYFGDNEGTVRSIDVDRWRVRWTISKEDYED